MEKRDQNTIAWSLIIATALCLYFVARTKHYSDIAEVACLALDKSYATRPSPALENAVNACADR